MTSPRLALLALLVISSSLTSFAADTKLLKQFGTESMDAVATQNQGVLKWSHGAFIYTDAVHSPGPTFRTLSRDGQMVSSLSLNIPGAEQISFWDFDRGTDDSIVFAGEAWSPSGQRSPFVAWLSPGNKTDLVIQTGNYRPLKLAVAPDGTVWTLGTEGVPFPRLDPNLHMLRHYDRQGKLLGSALPQSGLVSREDFDRITAGKLVAAQGRLGWYSAIDGKSRYVEISTQTMVQRTFPGLPAEYSDSWWDGGIDGLVLTDAGEVAVSIQDHKANDRRLYIFDRAASHWSPLPVQPLGNHPYNPLLMGSDGECLVFQYGGSAEFLSIARSSR